MTQTVGTPEKEDNQETHELSESGPMWEKIAQLIGDEELAREVFDQLKNAIQSGQRGGIDMCRRILRLKLTMMDE